MLASEVNTTISNRILSSFVSSLWNPEPSPPVVRRPSSHRVKSISCRDDSSQPVILLPVAAIAVHTVDVIEHLIWRATVVLLALVVLYRRWRVLNGIVVTAAEGKSVLRTFNSCFDRRVMSEEVHGVLNRYKEECSMQS